MLVGHAIALDFKLTKNHEAAKYAFTQAAHGQTKLSAYPFSNAYFGVLLYSGSSLAKIVEQRVIKK